MLFSTMAVQTIFTLIQVFSPSWLWFCALYFIVGMGQISNYVAAFILGTYSVCLGLFYIFFLDAAGPSLFGVNKILELSKHRIPRWDLEIKAKVMEKQRLA